ncbi:hypothetical protein V6N13_124885 [Hibiscus sabdariffa]|uniref:Uncharacterized protein n=1 Tax=Hibiscus sabdariffa TaxID=183260 RepID=A0ABR2U474_9ROSI
MEKSLNGWDDIEMNIAPVSLLENIPYDKCLVRKWEYMSEDSSSEQKLTKKVVASRGVVGERFPKLAMEVPSRSSPVGPGSEPTLTRTVVIVVGPSFPDPVECIIVVDGGWDLHEFFLLQSHLGNYLKILEEERKELRARVENSAAWEFSLIERIKSTEASLNSSKEENLELRG